MQNSFFVFDRKIHLVRSKLIYVFKWVINFHTVFFPNKNWFISFSASSLTVRGTIFSLILEIETD